MGAASSSSVSRSKLSGEAFPEVAVPVDKSSSGESKAASIDHRSVQDGTAATDTGNVTTAAENTTTPAATKQQGDKAEKTESEKEKEKKEKLRLQEEAYRKIDVDDVWLKVDETMDSNPPSLDQETRRSGWHTVRIFVSSTFRDFHTERDLLVKQVRPNLEVCYLQESSDLITETLSIADYKSRFVTQRRVMRLVLKATAS